MKLLLFFFFSNLVHGTPALMSLTDVSQVPSTSFTNEGTLLVSFQTRCAACKKQIQDLGCLENDFAIRLIGTVSSEKALRQEYRKMNTRYPAYLADTSVLSALGFEGTITPQIVLWTKNKSRRFYGYKKCETYKTLLSGVPNE